jgi:hypothetical protein
MTIKKEVNVKLSSYIKIFFIIIFSATAFAQNDSIKLPKYFYKNFEGTIGEKFSIKVNLIKCDSLLKGFYYYTNKKKPIFFTYDSKIDDKGNILIKGNTNNYDSLYRPITPGKYTGKFINEKEITGKWESSNGKKILPFKLIEVYPEGSVQIEMKYLSKEFADTSIKPPTSISFLYPQIILIKNKGIQDKINKSIMNALLEYNNEENEIVRYRNLEERIDSFMTDFKAARDSMKSLYADYNIGWESDYEITISVNENGILSLQCLTYAFLGGAHGSTFIDYLNFDLATGNEIKINDLFKDDYKTNLNRLGEKIFRKKFDVAPGKNLEDAGFWFKNNKFALNDNFGFTVAGILFQFNQYEIAPYVFGAPDVVIPYNKLKDIIKDGSILSKFLVNR